MGNNFTGDRYIKAFVQRLDREVHHPIAEEVDALPHPIRDRRDYQLGVAAVLPGQYPGQDARLVVT